MIMVVMMPWLCCYSDACSAVKAFIHSIQGYPTYCPTVHNMPVQVCRSTVHVEAIFPIIPVGNNCVQLTTMV